MRSRYRALSLISTIDGVVGWAIIGVAALVGLLMLLAFVITPQPHATAFELAVQLLMPLYGLGVGLAFVAASDLFLLAIDLAESTRQMATDVRELLRDRHAREPREQDLPR